MSRETELNDKDFLVQLITGKSLKDGINNDIVKSNDISDMIEEDLSKEQENVKNNNENVNEEDIKHDNITDNEDNIGKYKYLFINELKLLLKDHIKNRFKLFKKLIDKYENIPHGYVTEYRLLKNIYNKIRFDLLFNIIDSYILKSSIFDTVCILDFKVVLSALYYFILEYDGEEDSFPNNIILDNNILSKLIKTTESLPDNHPMKWSEERLNKVKNARNNYYAYIYYSDNMYSWYYYKWKEELGFSINDLSISDITLIYVLFTLFNKYSKVYTSDFILFDYMEKDVIYRFIRIIGAIFKIYTNELGRNVDYLFINNQIENLYILNDKNVIIGRHLKDFIYLDKLKDKLEGKMSKFELLTELINGLKEGGKKPPS